MYAILNNDREVEHFFIDKYSLMDCIGFMYLQGKHPIHSIQTVHEVHYHQKIEDGDIVKWLSNPIEEKK